MKTEDEALRQSSFSQIAEFDNNSDIFITGFTM